MPQMAPMNWTMLMIYFIIMFMIFNCMNYFNFLYNKKTFKTTIKSIKTNWKW
uniref:ATP synthase complex subunit 8 n=1 Tax=Cucujoidea sp. 44 KM-2017 TaxID=2219383 RepID=A0A346RHG6_9CUCU|nr:ATP synthase F0 subunit 8 [Cucujoidea sp. 44 KM-2017]